MTKKHLLLILNCYQNYFNDYVNISEEDLDNIYMKVAIADTQKNIDNSIGLEYLEPGPCIASERWINTLTSEVYEVPVEVLRDFENKVKL
jgi:hypothetical protein